MKQIRMCSTVALLLLLLLSVLAFPAAAEDNLKTGVCGPDLIWSLDMDTGCLTISGTGEMTDASAWSDSVSSIGTVEIGDGVTTICAEAFLMCKNLQTIRIPASMTHIGDNAFDCVTLTEARYMGTQEDWANIQIGVNNSTLSDAIVYHTDHVYDQQIPQPRYLRSTATCLEASTYYLSCSCGEAGTEYFSYGEPADHVGGEATCTSPALCDVCGTAYGEPDVGNHDFATTLTQGIDTHYYACSRCDEKQGEETHTYTAEVTAPTCTTDGYTTYTCDICGDTYTDDTIPATDHTPGEDGTCTICGASTECPHDYVASVTTDPTCTEEGVRTLTCSLCGDTKTESIPVVDHTYTPEITAPTCTTDGYTTYTCDVCGDTYTDDTTSATGHTPGAEATCTEDQTCTVCGEVLTPATGHTYTPEITAPTCTTDGYTTYTCDVCGDTYTDDTTSATGHTPGAEATCTVAQVCEVCGITLVPATGHKPANDTPCGEANTCLVCQAYIPPSEGHDYITSITKYPTCTGEGELTLICSRCSDRMTEVLPATGHNPGAEATCTDAQICKTCGEILAPAIGHSYTAVVTAPTCTEDGYTTYTCGTCGHSYTDDPVPATGHTPKNTASCGEANTCLVCGASIPPSASHDYVATVTADPTCTEEGVRTLTCSRCGDTKTEPIPAAGHTSSGAPTCQKAEYCTVCGEFLADRLAHVYRQLTVEATCTEEGYTLQVCTKCQYSHKTNVTPKKQHTPGHPATCTTDQVCTACGTILLARLGHNERLEIVSATCTEAGVTRHTCTRCDYTQLSDVVAPLGHTAGDWIIDMAPNGNTPGLAHKECTVCHATLETKVLEVTAPTETTTDTSPVETEPDDPTDTTESDTAESDTTETEPPDSETEKNTAGEDVTGENRPPEPGTRPGQEDDIEFPTGAVKDPEAKSAFWSFFGNFMVVALVLFALVAAWYIDYRYHH